MRYLSPLCSIFKVLKFSKMNFVFKLKVRRYNFNQRI